MSFFRVVLATALLWVIADSHGADPPAPNASASTRAFLAWKDELGLKEVLRFDADDATGDGLVVTLRGGNIENAIGAEAAQALYRRLFFKLAALSSVPPSRTTLRVDAQVGYCGAPVDRITIGLADKDVSFSRNRISPGGGVACMLDFEAIRRHEAELTSAVGTARAGLGASPSIQGDQLLTSNAVESLLTKHYAARGAQITVTGRAQGWLTLVVRRLQGEVLTGKTYWERLQLFIFLDQIQGATRVRLIVDGKYASGLAPPDDLAYTDMEPTYASSLSEYGRALVQAISKGG